MSTYTVLHLGGSTAADAKASRIPLFLRGTCGLYAFHPPFAVAYLGISKMVTDLRSARQDIDSKAQLAKIMTFLNVRYCTHRSCIRKLKVG